MDAIRALVNVTDHTVILRLPDSFRATRVEVIVLDADDTTRRGEAALPRRRSPSALLAGTRIVGDIMSPVVGDDDWGALK